MEDEFDDLSWYWESDEIQWELFKEAKSRRGNITYELVAQHIDFKNSFSNLLEPIIQKLEVYSLPNYISKIEEILNIIATGISKNDSLEAEHLLLTLYPMVQKGIDIC